MTAAEKEISLGIAPAEVWHLLLDFANYAAWHPFSRLKGEPQLGEIAYTYSSSLAPNRILRAPATIMRLEPHHCFEWRSGIRLLFLATESFTLEPSGAGTQMIYRMEYRGVVAALLRGKFTAKACDVAERLTQSLAAHVARRRKQGGVLSAGTKTKASHGGKRRRK